MDGNDILKVSIAEEFSEYIRKFGRGERIRTSDHLTPSQVRYQAALRPEVDYYIRALI